MMIPRRVSVERDPRRLEGVRLRAAGAAIVLLGGVFAAASSTAAAAPSNHFEYPANSAEPPFPEAVVSLASVSNGCGGGAPSSEARWGDTSEYYGHIVNFRLACNLHDAGYTGAEVQDPINGGYVDYFTWRPRNRSTRSS
jgi:hypothetical protein